MVKKWNILINCRNVTVVQSGVPSPLTLVILGMVDFFFVGCDNI